MTEALLLLSTGYLLTVCVATLTIAILAMRHARGYVDLAEERMEYLREEQTCLLMLLREERQRSQQEQDHRTRRDDGRKIDQLKRELLGLPQVQQESSSSLAAGSSEDTPRARERVVEKTWPTQKMRGAMTPWADTLSKPAEGSPEAKRQRLAVWHPHPDDDVSPERASTGRTRVQSGAPLKMFHRYYDRYLDNYQGYVKLAERLYPDPGQRRGATRFCSRTRVAGEIASRERRHRKDDR